jgi:hypothetical protein
MPKALFGVVVITGILAGLWKADASGQAWLQERGGYFFKLTGGYLYTTEEFNAAGDRQDLSADDDLKTVTSFRDVSVVAYVEYGVTDHLTLVANAPFKVLTTESVEGSREDSQSNGGLGDLEVYLRLPVVQRSFAVSVQPGLKIPLGYERTPDNDGPALGTGEIDGMIDLIAGLSLYPLPGYVSAGVGYRARGGDFDDEIVFGAEGGATIGRLFIKLRFEGLQNESGSTESPDEAAASPAGGGGINDLIIGNQDAYKLLPTISYLFSDTFEVTAEAYHTFAGKNTLAGTTFAAGIVLKR